MKVEEAKRIIASYLTGYCPVTREDSQPEYLQITRDVLQTACEVAQSDKEYVRYLMEELGLHNDWSSECDVFLSHVAEFSEISRQEREREMPELLAHVKACRSCREAYWDVRSHWISEAAAAVATGVRKVLAEPIQLAVGEAGRLLEQGLGPLAVVGPLAIAGAPMGVPTRGEALSRATPSMPVRTRGEALSEAATPALTRTSGRELLGRLDVEETNQKEWVLRDEDADCAIRLMVSGLPSGDVALRDAKSCVCSHRRPLSTRFASRYKRLKAIRCTMPVAFLISCKRDAKSCVCSFCIRGPG